MKPEKSFSEISEKMVKRAIWKTSKGKKKKPRPAFRREGR